MKIVMTITGAAVPDDDVEVVGRELIEVVRRHVRDATRSHVHVEAWTVTQPRAPQEAPPCAAAPSSSPQAPSPAPDSPTTPAPSASEPPSPGAASAPTRGTTPPMTGAPTSGGPTPAADDSSTPSAGPTQAPSPGSDAAGGGVIHLDQPSGTTGPTPGPWDDTSGQDDPATVHRLVTDGGPGFATGADLREAAFYMHDRAHGAGGIASHLGVPLGVVRGWLREETARA